MHFEVAKFPLLRRGKRIKKLIAGVKTLTEIEEGIFVFICYSVFRWMILFSIKVEILKIKKVIFFEK